MVQEFYETQILKHNFPKATNVHFNSVIDSDQLARPEHNNSEYQYISNNKNLYKLVPYI